jgi:hypothetical protein
MKPRSTRKSVVFPEPFGPRMARISPFFRSNETFASAIVEP